MATWAHLGFLLLGSFVNAPRHDANELVPALQLAVLHGGHIYTLQQEQAAETRFATTLKTRMAVLPRARLNEFEGWWWPSQYSPFQTALTLSITKERWVPPEHLLRYRFSKDRFYVTSIVPYSRSSSKRPSESKTGSKQPFRRPSASRLRVN
jgi:hypothetical protein